MAGTSAGVAMGAAVGSLGKSKWSRPEALEQLGSFGLDGGQCRGVSTLLGWQFGKKVTPESAIQS